MSCLSNVDWGHGRSPPAGTVGLHDHIMRLPRGYDRFVGEPGSLIWSGHRAPAFHHPAGGQDRPCPGRARRGVRHASRPHSRQRLLRQGRRAAVDRLVLVQANATNVANRSSSRPSEARAGIIKRETLQSVTIPDKASPFRDDASGDPGKTCLASHTLLSGPLPSPLTQARLWTPHSSSSSRKRRRRYAGSLKMRVRSFWRSRIARKRFPERPDETSRAPFRATNRESHFWGEARRRLCCAFSTHGPSVVQRKAQKQPIVGERFVAAPAL